MASREDLYRLALGCEDGGEDRLVASGGLIAPTAAVYHTIDVTGIGDVARRDMVVRIARAFDVPTELILGKPGDDG